MLLSPLFLKLFQILELVLRIAKIFQLTVDCSKFAPEIRRTMIRPPFSKFLEFTQLPVVGICPEQCSRFYFWVVHEIIEENEIFVSPFHFLLLKLKML